MLPPFFVGVCAIKNGDLVLFGVDVVYQIIETHLGYHFSHLVKLMVVVIEEVTCQLDVVVLIRGIVPIIYFLL